MGGWCHGWLVGRELAFSWTSTALPICCTPSCPLPQPNPHTENITCPDFIIQGFVFDQKWESEKLLNSLLWPLGNCLLMVCVIDPRANLGNQGRMRLVSGSIASLPGVSSLNEQGEGWMACPSAMSSEIMTQCPQQGFMMRVADSVLKCLSNHSYLIDEVVGG